MIWTLEIESHLRRRWAEGASAATIAREITGATRSGIIGKVHRMGIAHRDKGCPPPVRYPKFRVARENPPKQDPLLKLFRKLDIKEPPKQAEFLGVDIFDLNADMCRFPRGDKAPYLFCGQPALDGSSYCAYCHDLTHNVVIGSRPVRKGIAKHMQRGARAA